MKKLMCLMLLCCLTYVSAIGQGRYDANWVFGQNCGMRFEEDSTVTLFEQYGFNAEASFTLSDSQGSLFLYSSYLNGISILDPSGNPIVNGTGIRSWGSITNGWAVLYFNKSKVIKFVNIDPGSRNSCGNYRCDSVFRTTISSPFDQVSQNEKNVALGIGVVQEKIAQVKHINGEDWWLIFKEGYVSGASNNAYRVVLSTSFSDSIYPVQNIGFSSSDDIYWAGEMTFSNSGNYLLSSFMSENVIDLLSFNRCEATLGHINTIAFTLFQPYSVSFSSVDSVFYVSGDPDNGGGLAQIVLMDSMRSYQITPLWLPNNGNIKIGQLQRAPNGKIYLSAFNARFDSTRHYFSVINNPEVVGVGCDFQPFSVYMGDSCKINVGLPNMPNYNLGATSIYQADAGVDTFLCISDTVAKGMSIGADSVPGVSYDWLNVDVSNVNKYQSRAFVAVDSSTWFYLQLTDTTIQGSCQTRIDSVLVERRLCTGVEEIDLAQVKVYPNPSYGRLNIDMPSDGKVELYDLSGRELFSQQLVSGTNNIDLRAHKLSSGMFIYKIYLNGKLAITDRSVLMY